MSITLDVVSEILNLVSSIFPNATQIEKDKLTLALQENDAITKILLAQSDINKTEAQSENLFKSGWRPAIGWVCAISFIWSYVARPVFSYCLELTGHTVPNFPDTQVTDMINLLGAMLGVGGMRTYEKMNGVK